MSRITFGGLVSGLDTNTIIDYLMQLERKPIERKEEKIKELEQNKNCWRDIAMRIRHLRDTLQPLMKPDLFHARLALTGDEAVVTAFADGKARVGEYHLEVIELAQYHTIAMPQEERLENPSKALGKSGTFSINGKVEITVESGDSLLDIRDKINEANGGIVAQVTDHRLILQSTEMGLAHAIVLEDREGELLKELGILDEEGNFRNVIKEAQDARFNFNGIDITRATNEIDDLVEGVIFHLRGKGEAYVRVSVDSEKPAEALQAFVDQYNSVNAFIREKLDKDSGQLRGDPNLMRIERTLRSLVSQPVRSGKKYNSLAAIGITTVDKEGFLQFDRDRLEKALEEDPGAVADLFRYWYDGGEGAGGHWDGAAVRLEDYLRTLLDNRSDDRGRTVPAILSMRQQSIDRQIEELNRRIEAREERLLRYEDRLIKQFTALERAVASMQNQSQDLERMIGQLTGFGKN